MSFRYAGIFSGVGMLELACERLGGEPVFMCESDPFCRTILERRFPGVPCYPDVTELTGVDAEIDVLVGGFPCQDISAAGRGVGIHGSRSGLWGHFARLIDELHPKLVLIENVAMLTRRGLDVVLADLCDIDYYAEWDIIPAAALGAHHLRERIFISARPGELAFASARTYGPILRRLDLTGKLPRAGLAEEGVGYELEPVAKRKLKRQDGWSHWVGVDLLDLGDDQVLVPTPTASRYGSSQNGINGKGGENERPSAGTPSLETMAQAGLWPTPTATMADRGGRGDLLQAVRGNVSPSGHFRAGGLWPTPQHADGSGGRLDMGAVERADGKVTLQRPSGSKASTTLATAVEAVRHGLWPTPQARDYKDSGGSQGNRKSPNLGTMVHLASANALWPTPHGMARDEYDHPQGPSGNKLGHAVNQVQTGERAKLWRTPCASDGSGGGMDPAKRIAQGHTLNLQEQVFGEGHRGSLNPTWVEWLMAMPIGWTDPEVDEPVQLPWWIEPADVPRVASRTNARRPRLKAVGNSVVWPCAAYALERALIAAGLHPSQQELAVV